MGKVSTLILGALLGASAMWMTAQATPHPSIQAQLDIDGNCEVNFPGDTLMHAKIALGVLPMPTWLPTCPEWYATAAPTATDTPTP